VYRTVAGEHTDEAGRPLVLPNPELGFVNEIRVRWGVAELEEYQRQGGHITVREPVSANLIRQHLGVEVTRYRFDSRQLVGVLSAIRARLAENLHRYTHVPVPAAGAAAPTLAHAHDEIFEMKPGFAGFAINLRALHRRFSAWLRERRG
jgi:hypothetical protein